MPSTESPAAASEIQSSAPSSISRRTYWLPLLVSWLFCAVWIWLFLLRQWVPHDEGAFADIAARVLRGEVPHRDFLDLYTGGLSYLNAFAWKLFGHDLAVFRYVMYVFVLGWLPALYYVATRFVPPTVAAMVVAIAAVWSLPNYPAAVPSWYNLFFATWGMAALLRYSERTSPRWLFLGGVCGGLSFLIKVSGLFFVFAAALFLVYRSQENNQSQHGRTATMLRIIVTLAVMAVVFRVISGWLTARTIAYFLGPALVVGAVLIGRELRVMRGRTGGSARDLWRELLVLSAGVVLPIAVFLLMYLHGGFADWVRGVFILPARRIQFAPFDPPPVSKIALAVGVWLVCGAMLSSRRRLVQVIGAAVLVLDLVLAFSSTQAFHFVWRSLSCAIPAATVVAAFLCLRDRQRLFLLTVVTVLCSMVQFPFSAPVYFSYIVPLLVVLIAAVFSTRPHVSPVGAAIVLACYLFAGIALIDRGNIYTLGDYYARPALTGHLQVPGAQKLRILPEQAAIYNAMIPVVKQHARGEYVYASPSAPEVYFLSGHQNPVPWIFDFFDDRSTDLEFTAGMLESHGINVVVINMDPDFDPAPTPEMMAMYRQRYPHAQRFGRFEVRWRE